MAKRRIIGAIVLLLSTTGFEWSGDHQQVSSTYENAGPIERAELLSRLVVYPRSEVETLILRGLQDDDARVRAAAADVAAHHGYDAARPVLITWLDDIEPEARAQAARSLARFEGPEEREALIRALGDSDASVRAAAVGALASHSDSAVIAPIAARLDDDDDNVRIRAAEALGERNDPRVTVPLVGRARDEVPEVRMAVIHALARSGDVRGESALQLLAEDDDENVALAAIGALGQLGGDSAIGTLVQLSRSPSTRHAEAAVRALGALSENESARAALVAMLAPSTSPQTSVVSPFLISAQLELVEDETLNATLIDFLAAAPAQQRLTLLPLIERRLERLTPGPDGVPDLEQRLLALHERGYGAVYYALALVGGTDSLIPLLSNLDTGAITGRTATLPSIRTAGDVGRLYASSRARPNVHQARRLYFERCPPNGLAIDPIAVALQQSTVPSDQASLLASLGAIRSERAFQVIRPYTEADNDTVRLAAIQALGAQGEQAASSSLLALLDSDSARVRFEAALAIGRADSVEVIPALLELLVRRTATDRRAVLLALRGPLSNPESDAEMKREAADIVFSFARRRDSRISGPAIDALSPLAAHSPHALALLVQLTARGTSQTRSRAVEVLAPHAADNAEIRDIVRNLAGEQDRDIRRAALAGFGWFGAAASAEDIQTLQSQPRLAAPSRIAASWAIAHLAVHEALSGESLSRESLCSGLRSATSQAEMANLVLALAARQELCDEMDPVTLFQDQESIAVKLAAIRWMRSVDLPPRLRRASETALQECTESPYPELATCATTSELEPPVEGELTFPIARGVPAAERLLLFRGADGSTWISRTDALGSVRPPFEGPATVEEVVGD